MGRQGRFFAAGLAAVLVALVGGGAVRAAPPANDNFANAAVISGSGSLSADNSEATREAGEPFHAGDVGGKSIWYAWTPGFDGVASIDTGGTGFDTLLAVYTGSTLAGLTTLASNDDVDQSASVSRVCFTVAAATTYAIAVDGYDGVSGSITLHYGQKLDTGPCPTIPATISGAAQPKVGDTLTVTGGSFVDGSATRTIEWSRCVEIVCFTIHDATGPTYVVQERDVGTAIQVEERVTTPSGTAKNESAPTGTVSAPATTHPNGRIYWTTDRDVVPGVFDIHSMFPSPPALVGISNQQATSGATWTTEPAVSPDGKKVAFVDLSNNHIERMNADGSGIEDLGVVGQFPTWSPDGSRIAFVSSLGIESVDEHGNEVELVPLAPGSTDGKIDWSPDGTKIAFGLRFRGHTDLDIAIVSADGRGPIRNLTSSPADDHDPSWSPTGDKIAFDRGPVSGAITDGDLYVVDTSTFAETLLFDGDAAHIAEFGTDWSPDGNTVLFTRVDNGNSDVFARILTGGPPLIQLTSDGHRDELPSWGVQALYTFTVTKAGSGGGTVRGLATGPLAAGSPSSNPSFLCGDTCTATYPDPFSVSLGAEGAGGSSFDGWSGACSGRDSCVVSMLGDRNVTATFTAHSGGGAGGGGGGGGGSSSLALSVTPASQTVASGGTATWTVSVTNAGGAYLYAVGVRDAAAPGCVIPTSFADTASLMAPGVTISYNCSLAGVTTSLTNTVVATATTGPGDLLTQTATGGVTVQASPTPAPNPQTPRGPSTVSKLHTITGTNRADRLIGTAAADLINGLGGNDSINGGKGDDTLNGNGGNDTIVGGPGRDKITGGPGKDLITARDGTSDTIACGTGRDIVNADKIDKVARNCEVVRRS